MRYHCIINAYSDDAIRQMEEFHAFQDAFLKDAEQGEAYILCRGNEDIELLARRIAENAVTVTGPDYSPEAVLEVLEQEADSEDLYIFGSGYSGIELSVRLSERLGGKFRNVRPCLGIKGICDGKEDGLCKPYGRRVCDEERALLYLACERNGAQGGTGRHVPY